MDSEKEAITKEFEAGTFDPMEILKVGDVVVPVLEESKKPAEQDSFVAALHEELVRLADGQTEDNIPLSSLYWAIKNKLQVYLTPKD